jgi:hypothetical protein
MNNFDLIQIILTVGAVLIAPILALWLQNRYQDKKELYNRRLQIFRTLIATRGEFSSRLSVECLNLIDVEFYEQSSVREAWSKLARHLNARDGLAADWLIRTRDLQNDLLLCMGKALNIEFNIDVLGNSYTPQAYLNEAETVKKLQELQIQFYEQQLKSPMDIGPEGLLR